MISKVTQWARVYKRLLSHLARATLGCFHDGTGGTTATDRAGMPRFLFASSSIVSRDDEGWQEIAHASVARRLDISTTESCKRSAARALEPADTNHTFEGQLVHSFLTTPARVVASRSPPAL